MKFRNVNTFHLSGTLWLGLLLLGLSASLAQVCSAQGEASIQGTVSDSTGGAIGSAAIRIKNLETGAERNLITDEAGRYDAASLPVGRYDVRAEKNGFRSQEKTGISLAVGQRETVDFVLQVGDVHQTVQVEAVPRRGVRHYGGCLRFSGRAGSQRPSSEWAQLRSADDAQSRSGELHLAARRRNRDFKFRRRKYVRGFRAPASRKSLPAEWSRIHQRLGDQQHARRSERAASGRGRRSRVFGREGLLRRGVRQASRSSDQYRDCLRNKSAARRRV